RKIAARWQLENIFIDGVRRRDRVIAKEQCQRIAIDAAIHAFVSAKRLQFGTEEQSGSRPRIVKRLLAKAITREQKPALLPVPKRKRKHAVEAAQSAGRSPRLAGFENHFGIGTSAKARALGLQLRPQFLKVINLAVVSDHVAAAGREHGLMPARRRIDDREPAVAECHACAGIYPCAVIIGAAVP